MFEFKDCLDIKEQLCQLKELHADKSNHAVYVISAILLLGLVVCFPLVLPIWCSVGADVINGEWAIYGALAGVYDCNLTTWDFNDIINYDW